MTRRWDWRAHLTPSEAALVETYEARIKVQRSAVHSVPKEGRRTMRAMLSVTRQMRLVIVNRGTARARLKAGLGNPSRKSKSAAEART